MGWGLPGVLLLLPSPTVVPCPQIPKTLAMLPRIPPGRVVVTESGIGSAGEAL